MDSVAKRTLDEVRQRQLKSSGLPHTTIRHNIVYGLHWNKEYLQILAHFTYYKDDSSMKYCQAVAARPWITRNPERVRTAFHSEDIAVLDR